MLDSTLIFDGTLPSTGVAVTSTRVSTNVIDLLTGRDIGVGNTQYITVLVTTAFTSTNSATLQVQFEVCSTAGGSYLPLLLSPVIVATNLIAGAVPFQIVVPPNGFNNATSGIVATPGQFLRLTYTVGTGVFSAGAVMAWLGAAPDRNNYRSYPRNYTVYTDPDQITV